ncbi:MAG: dihydropteroate synthase, partial [Candidatus Eremiobacteraeota bacterium]|nr:dihydropteroate synthase [Candidatus Eremiobacteraeota bacterium]
MTTLVRKLQPSARGALRIRNRELAWGSRTYLMGIVNASPDSFSGDGTPDAIRAIHHAVEQARSGADVIDIGGESTRPGHTPIAVEIERERLLPVIRGVRRALGNDSIISADTFKPV